MALEYCGIDEAGYGPLLGPLCVGCAVFRVEHWAEGDPAPDLWKLLERAVCREGSDKRRRIAVDDSKKLKLANSSIRRHPLHHLERGVLSFLGARGNGAEERKPPDNPLPPSTDLAFFQTAGVTSAPESWYTGDALPFPLGSTADEIAIATNTLRLALADSGISILSLRAEAVSESSFNEIVEASGTKAAVTESVLLGFLADAWDNDSGGEASLRIICDRQGGRTQYAHMLRRAFPEAAIQTVAETPAQSKYELRSASPERRMSVAFKVEAEASHLPVALASMIAKLTRELFMARFNRYWCARIPELKPTAGYALDARRWLRDTHAAITPDERRALIRRA